MLGAGDSGHLLVKNLLSHRRMSYKPVAVLDDNLHLRGSTVYEVPVEGPLSHLPRTLEENSRVAAVILAIRRSPMHASAVSKKPAANSAFR